MASPFLVGKQGFVGKKIIMLRLKAICMSSNDLASYEADG